MADPTDAYQRSIDQAAKIYGAAADAYNAIRAQMDALEVNPTDVATGGPKEAQYAALTKQLGEAQKRFNTAEQSYQSAIEAQDKAKVAAKEVYPAGQTRTRLDTTSGNVLVSVTETADGRGGWSVDPNSVKRVQVAGSQAAGTRIAAPTSDKYIVTLQDDGTLKQEANPNYQPDKSAGPQAVPTSEFIYQDGQVKENPAYRPQAPIVNTEAQQIPDPANPGKFMPNPNYVKPAPPPMTPGQAAVDTATASTATDTATAALSKAQADAKLAQANLEDAQRRARQAPTDQQAQQAIAAAQRNADLANQQLENAIAQAGNLNPIAVEQARATLEQTRANTQKGLQGDLYGRQEQIRQIRSLVASGDIGTAEADQMVNALNRGTSVYQAQTQMQADRTSARGQDLSNKNALAGNFTSAMTSGFSTLADMNKYAKVGSTAGADAFLGLLNIAQDRLKSYELPPAQTTDYLGLTSQPSAVSGMVQAAQQQIQQPVQQPVGQTGAHQVTINIGGTTPQPATPYQPAPTTYNNTPETSAASAERNNLAGLVSEAARRVPAGLDDINAAYGVQGVM